MKHSFGAGALPALALSASLLGACADKIPGVESAQTQAGVSARTEALISATPAVPGLSVKPASRTTAPSPVPKSFAAAAAKRKLATSKSAGQVAPASDSAVAKGVPADPSVFPLELSLSGGVRAGGEPDSMGNRVMKLIGLRF